MKFTKGLSALAVAVTCFAAMSAAASAADVDMTFAGGNFSDGSAGMTVEGVDGTITVTKGSNKGSYNGGSKVAMTNTDPELKALFDADNDGNVDAKYTACLINYIGKNPDGATSTATAGTPEIAVDLEAGNYKLYYVARTKQPFTIMTAENADVFVGSEISIGDNLWVYPVSIYLPTAYSGNITFTRDGGWLPDLYSVKLVDDAFPTEADTVKAMDVKRPTRGTRNAPSEAMTPNDDYTDAMEGVFGANFEKAGTTQLTYTDGDADYYYMEVKEPGTYSAAVLSANNTNTKFEFMDYSGTTLYATADAADMQKVGTRSGGGVYVGISNEVELAAGTYRVCLKKLTDSKYYSNFIASGLIKSEPVKVDPEVAVTKAVSYAAVDEDDTDATGVEVAIKTNDYAVKGLSWKIGKADFVTEITQLAGGTEVTATMFINNLFVDGLKADGVQVSVTDDISGAVATIGK